MLTFGLVGKAAPNFCVRLRGYQAGGLWIRYRVRYAYHRNLSKRGLEEAATDAGINIKGQRSSGCTTSGTRSPLSFRERLIQRMGGDGLEPPTPSV